MIACLFVTLDLVQIVMLGRLLVINGLIERIILRIIIGLFVEVVIDCNVGIMLGLSLVL